LAIGYWLLAKANKTFIVQASLTIVTYDRKNTFIVQAKSLAFWSALYSKELDIHDLLEPFVASSF
jgi:hypothetical protein